MRLALITLAAALLGAPAAAQSLPSAPVWLPPENFHAWNELDALLRSRSELKLTVALAPEMADAAARTSLGPWAAAGRVEIAARVGGDPILTLVASHPAAPRPQDALERAVETRDKLAARLESAPAGLVLGAGALDGALASVLGAAGASWILIGPYADASAPWASTGKALLVPARALSSAAEDDWATPGAGIYDESASTASVFLAELAKLPSRARPALGWALVGELARAKAGARLEFPSIAAWPAWYPAAAQIPPADPSVRAAWDAYGAAAAAIDRYQNSGAADLKTLDAAVELLRRAQDSRLYRPDAASELRARLLAVYKRLKLPAPESLYGGAAPGVDGSGSGEGPTGVKATAGPSWLEFRNPAGATTPAPIAAGAASTAAANADAWTIRGLRAEWDDAAVRLTLSVARPFSGPPRPVYEIYLDFNHVLGAGRVPLLGGRGAVVPARDAWELALSIVGEEARLYRARGAGEPEEIAVFKAATDAERGEIAAAVPRSFLRGNPARWGWTVVALAEDPARPARRPAAALSGPDGAVLLGVLAPLDVQKAVLTRAGSRVPASRLEP